MKATHFLIQGHVQGVSFRYFVEQHASDMGLKGWVRNLRDGRVEALVLGSTERVVELHSLLKTGPPRAIVQTVVYAEVEVEESYSRFLIKTDGESPWSEK